MTEERRTGREIQSWADANMFEAEPIAEEDRPRVELLWATPDPLGAVAAAYRMYEGKPTYSLADITDEQRRYYWGESFKTHIKAPWEFIKFHFFIEGVSRAFTHQMVRQRTAVYAQESLRFAVKESMKDEAILPPTIREGSIENDVWDSALDNIQEAYNYLVANGVPAEDARGLLPTNVATRLNYCTDLRALALHAGNRLCTQAQYEWRAVFARLVESIRNHIPEGELTRWQDQTGEHRDSYPLDGHWQFKTIAESELFRPVCFAEGRCPWGEEMARPCTIRERMNTGRSAEVRPEEWLLDVNAARRG